MRQHTLIDTKALATAINRIGVLCDLGRTSAIVSVKEQALAALEDAKQKGRALQYGNTYPWCDMRHDHYNIEVVEPEEKTILCFTGIIGGNDERRKSVAARLRATADQMDPPSDDRA